MTLSPYYFDNKLNKYFKVKNIFLPGFLIILSIKANKIFVFWESLTSTTNDGKTLDLIISKLGFIVLARSLATASIFCFPTK